MLKLVRGAINSLASKPWAWLALLLLAIFLHSANMFKGGLYADDYIHAAYFQGTESLAEKGLLSGIEHGSAAKLLSQQFNFFDPNSENYAALKEMGVLPWWTSPDALLHFFRPLATLTHYIDYQYWPENTHVMHGMNVLWYVLALLAIAYFYKSLSLTPSVIYLALLLIILDLSVFQVVSWVASRSMLMLIAFGFFAVAAYHHAANNNHLRWYAVSLLSFIAALLSAEGGIAITGYLGAYCFTLDKRKWPQRIVALLPFAMVVIAWRIYYQSQGFGAFGVDFYLDPGREPLSFLQAALYRYPGNLFELWSGIDFTSGQIRADIRQCFAIVGIAVLALFTYILKPFLFGRMRNEHKALSFLGLGCLFALVPGLSIALSPRVMLLPNVGFAILLAYSFLLLPQYLNAGSKFKRVMAALINGYTLVVHIILSCLVACLMWYSTMDFSGNKTMARGNVDLGVQDFAAKPVIVINALRPFWMSFVPYELAYKKQALPESVRVLTSAFYPVIVKRVSENSLLLTSEPAFQLDPEYLVPFGQQEHAHYAFLTQQLLGLVRSQRKPWVLGQQYEFTESNITVMALHQGKPSQIQLDLKSPSTSYRFSYWNMQEEKYQPFILPAIGEQRELDGIFNSVNTHGGSFD